MYNGDTILLNYLGEILVNTTVLVADFPLVLLHFLPLVDGDPPRRFENEASIGAWGG